MGKRNPILYGHSSQTDKHSLLDNARGNKLHSTGHSLPVLLMIQAVSRSVEDIKRTMLPAPKGDAT